MTEDYKQGLIHNSDCQLGMKVQKDLILSSVFEFAEAREGEHSKACQTHVALASAEGYIFRGLLSNSVWRVRGLHALTPRCVYVAMALVCSTGHGA